MKQDILELEFHLSNAAIPFLCDTIIPEPRSADQKEDGVAHSSCKRQLMASLSKL
jgi:hypothetical protein